MFLSKTPNFLHFQFDFNSFCSSNQGNKLLGSGYYCAAMNQIICSIQLSASQSMRRAEKGGNSIDIPQGSGYNNPKEGTMTVGTDAAGGGREGQGLEAFTSTGWTV